MGVSMKWLSMLCVLCASAATVQAASLKDHELHRLLEQVAKESSVGTPRAINENLLDQGYTAEGSELINYISVQPRHAAMMRDNPKQVRKQLVDSVCANQGFKKLLQEGATLRYEFSEYKSNRPVATERFTIKSCAR